MGKKYAEYDASRTVIAFYDDAICAAPKGAQAVALTDAQYVALIAGQAAGKRMAIAEDGSPVLLDSLPPTDDQRANERRAARDSALAATDWIVARHQDELLAGAGTTLTAAQLDALLAYRKTLRDLPLATGWPAVDLPAVPDFVTAIA